MEKLFQNREKVFRDRILHYISIPEKITRRVQQKHVLNYLAWLFLELI